MARFQEKFSDLQSAIRSAKTAHAQEHIIIIESRGEFFLEDTQGTFVRNWERQVFSGKGWDARAARS